ncbi:MAG: DNA methylase [Clostridia bacterium]|nr:DNA methylase [Clostridia bacterium]
MERQRAFIAIDLKSFYASVECSELGLDPLDACLAVADESRTEKTICLAVSPALKSYGVGGRPRLFEVIEMVKAVNAQRLQKAPGHRFTGKSTSKKELDSDPSLELDFIAARPRMALYMDYSRRIVSIYTKYVSFDDMHVYSVDEVFIDATAYLNYFRLSPHELAIKMIRDVLAHTGITATAGIGTNLYLSKIAMDIVAKRMPADRDGVRIAELDEKSYREKLWSHTPLTDFWRVGRGIARKLNANGMRTMGDVARCSIGAPGEHFNEDLLYKLFGVNAELLIDHAWGWESCEISDIKAYRADNSSLSNGQVLASPYEADKARLVLKEMALSLSYELNEKKLITDKIDISVCYDSENLSDPERMAAYKGAVESDFYGRSVPKTAHGSRRLKTPSAISDEIVEAAAKLYDDITDKRLLVRRMYIAAANVRANDAPEAEQMSIFDTPGFGDEAESEKLEKESKRVKAVMDIQRRYGKNAIMRGMSLEEGATGRERNAQVGGHRA